MDKKIFEYHLILRATDEEREAGHVSEEMITDAPKTVFAVDEKGALMQAARAIPEKYADKLDQIEVALRPF